MSWQSPVILKTKDFVVSYLTGTAKHGTCLRALGTFGCMSSPQTQPFQQILAHHSKVSSHGL